MQSDAGSEILRPMLEDPMPLTTPGNQVSQVALKYRATEIASSKGTYPGDEAATAQLRF